MDQIELAPAPPAATGSARRGRVSLVWCDHVLGQVRDTVGEGAAHDVVRRAGLEGRIGTAPDPGEEGAASVSVDEFRRLLEVASEALGGADRLVGAGARLSVGPTESGDLMRAPGSLAEAFANLAEAHGRMSGATSLSVESAGPDEWLVRQSFAPGVEPFKTYCWFAAGLVGAVPRLVGFASGGVVEEQCQCEGATACVFRVRASASEDPSRRAEHLDRRVEVLESRLASVLQIVGDLAAEVDDDVVLARMVSDLGRAPSAAAYVLAVETAPDSPRRVYAAGLSTDEGDLVALDLLSGDGRTRPGRHVVEVASKRRHYGWLAAIDSGGRPRPSQDAALLEEYGRVAAAVLDSTAAREASRREAARAHVVLELSRSLAEPLSVEEIAERLVNAVPAVAECDRAVVALINVGERAPKVVGTYGYSLEATEELLGRPVEMPAAGSAQTSRPEDRLEGNQPSAGPVDLAGGVSVAIELGGEVIGWLYAMAGEGADPFIHDPDAGERLAGLAGQAAIAIRNARLLEQIRHQALHDSLTGLPNRALILDRAEMMLARARRTGRPGGVLFVDLDNFKNINDTLGHKIGDEILKSVAARITMGVRDSDTVGRLGGDEFVVLVEDVMPGSQAEVVAERVLEALAPPFELAVLEGVPFTMSASIGIAIGDRPSSDELLRDADIALYRAKASGKRCYVTFEEGMQAEVLSRLELELDLRSALSEGQLFLVYQPMFELAHVAMTGVEALLRWRHPLRGVIMPDEFVSTVEDTGMVHEVGRFVLHEACTQVAAWNRAGHRLRLSVNISIRQLESDRFLEDVRSALLASELDPSLLVIEVSETSLMQNRRVTVRLLSLLKALGVGVSIDDFGTGYSSLAYLQQLPVDSVKIDQSFIAEMLATPESLAVIHTLVELGHALGLETYAEGIETPEQLEQLRKEHYFGGQGYLFSVPLEPRELEARLEREALRGVPAEDPGAGG